MNSILVYDFGITLSFKYSDTYSYEKCAEIFQNQDEKCSDIEPLIDFVLFFMDFKETEKDIIRNYFTEKQKTDSELLRLNPKKFFTLLLNLAKETDRYLNISSLRLIILLIQMFKYYEKYYRVDSEDIVKEVFRNRLTENYTLCKTDNICPHYMKYLENELNKQNQNIDELFSINSDIINNNINLLKEIKKNI